MEKQIHRQAISSPYASSKTRIYLQEFIDNYKESIGLEGARVLLHDATQQIGIVDRENLTKTEALQVCQILRKQPGFVSIVAGILASRLRFR